MKKRWHQLKLKARRWRIKTMSWEYWPMQLVYLPAAFYYIYLSIKARSLFFFSLTNPLIENGGMFFDSKWKIYQMMPKEYIPNTVFSAKEESVEQIEDRLSIENLHYPLIAKPNRGERGLGVRKIGNRDDLKSYKNQYQFDIIFQEFIDFPLEFSVFYYRLPNEQKGVVSSLTRKDLLTIVGDGKSTIEALIVNDDRAFLQMDVLLKNETYKNEILERGETRLLVPYGNHCRGAKFVDCSQWIDEELCHTFDTISKQIDQFYYGRFDLKTTSLEDLKKGRKFSIIELNGTKAEVAHIYNPGFPFLKAQLIIFKHIGLMWRIAMQNKKVHKGMKWAEFIKAWKMERNYKKSI